MAVTGFLQHLSDFFDVFVAACFERDVDDRIAEAYSIVGAVVGRLHYIGAGVGEDARELVQRPRAVGEVDAETGAASVLDQAAFDDTREQADVDVASADEDGGSLAAQRGLVL